MLDRKFEKIVKDRNFELFKMEFSHNLLFFKSLLSYLNCEKLYKIDLEGNVYEKDFSSIFKLLELYFYEYREETLKEIFNYLTFQKNKIKFKKIFRYSSINLEKVKEKFFKVLLNKERIFSFRYGKELFLRNEKEFKKIIITISLFNFGYKSSYAFSLIRLLEIFPKALDELLFVFINAYCLEENNFYFYNKAYFIESKKNEESIIKIIESKNYSFLKFYIQIDIKNVLKILISLYLKNIQKITLNFLTQLELLIYFFNSNKNKNLIIENSLLSLFIALDENFYSVRKKNIVSEEYIVECTLKNIQKMLG